MIEVREYVIACILFTTLVVPFWAGLSKSSSVAKSQPSSSSDENPKPPRPLLRLKTQNELGRRVSYK